MRNLASEMQHQHHVLVIDDDLAIRILVREMLQEAGYRTTLETTMLGLDDVKEHRPDLVILDPMTGGGTRGWQLLQELKADPQTAALPVVVCTGAVRRVRDEGWRLAHQGVELVLKPFELDELLCAVASLLLSPVGGSDGGEREPGSRGTGPDGAEVLSRRATADLVPMSGPDRPWAAVIDGRTTGIP